MTGWRALTLHQPWAQLVALGVKTIETRSWSTSYRGPLAIHAGKNTEYDGWKVGDYRFEQWFENVRHRAQECDCEGGEIAPSCMRGATRRPALTQGLDLVSFASLGAVVATCTLVDVVPMVPGDMRFDSGGGLIPEPDLPHLAVTRQELTLWQEEPFVWGSPNEFGEVDLADQRPYGDFSPGGFAWALADVRALPEPIPAKGRQGLWVPPPDVISALTWATIHSEGSNR